MVYCVLAVAEAAVGKGSGVAVYSRVGSGVSVGGTGVKVDSSVGVAVPGIRGWNGVGVADASGFGETKTSWGRSTCAYGGNEQPSKTKTSERSASRRGVFIEFYSFNKFAL
jgi:hypothetical protein